VSRRAGIAAGIVAVAVAALSIGLVVGSGSKCGGATCDLRLVEAPCDQLGDRDLNPADERINPRRREPLLPARQDGRLQVGFNDSAFEAGQASLLENAALHRAAGSTIWRIPLDWRRLEPQPGEYDFGVGDAVYCAALGAGIKPLFHLTGAPAWAADETIPCNGPCLHPPLPSNLDELGAIAERVAIRYPEAAAIEAWNEPNLRQFWDRPDPERYFQVLRAIYTGVKNGNPRMPVLGGSLSNNQQNHPLGSLSLPTFLNAIYSAGAGRYMDAISFHPYPLHPLDDPRQHFSRTLAQVRATIAHHEAPGARRLWVTEVGAGTVASPISAQLTPDQQAELMLEIYTRLDAAADVDVAVFHTLVDPNERVASPPGFGWVTPTTDREFFPKPAYCAFAERLAEPLDCSEPVPLPD
jgi:hypothetical protein